MPTKTVYRFPLGALEALERQMQGLEADVISYPTSFGADRDRNLLVLVVQPDANIPELVRALLSAKQDANHVPSLPEMLRSDQRCPSGSRLPGSATRHGRRESSRGPTARKSAWRS